jgi:hypothetical protein
MKSLLFILVSFSLLSSALASGELTPLKPGRFLLVTSGNFYIPPIMVQISASDKGDLNLLSEGSPKLSAEIIQDGSSYIFKLTIPGSEIPSISQDSPKNYYMTYAGTVPNLPFVGLQGVCSTTFTYHHIGSGAQSEKGSFVLYSTDKTEQGAAANP